MIFYGNNELCDPKGSEYKLKRKYGEDSSLPVKMTTNFLFPLQETENFNLPVLPTKCFNNLFYWHIYQLPD